MAEQVEDFIQKYTADHKDIHIITYYEKELLGSGGTVSVNRDFIEKGEDFLICYADNLTDVNLGELVKEHQKKNALLTMALFRTNVPRQCGIAAVNEKG